MRPLRLLARRPLCLLGALIGLWSLVLVKQYAFIQEIEQKPAYTPESGQVLQSATRVVDATFNGVALEWRTGTPVSSVHCVGGGTLPPHVSWMSRSCEFTNLCYDPRSHSFGLFTSNENTQPLSLGGINPRWLQTKGLDKNFMNIQWSPPVWNATLNGYYQLNDVLVLFHSFAAHNVGHLLWDDFYPIYSLMRLFGLQERSFVPIRQKLEHPLYATCDIRKNKRKQCANNFVKFWPLMGVDPVTFSTNTDVRFARPGIVCAQTAVAGIGMLTDHGLHDHGWEGKAWRPHNLGRGPVFEAFRDFLVERIAPQVVVKPRVVFSMESSRDWDRRLNFTHQIQRVQRALPSADVQGVRLWEMGLSEQIQLAASTRVLVTACGGGSMTASFLPRGSSLILMYNQTGGFDFASYKLTESPARLDWDLLNNAGHLRVHWFPVATMESENDLELLAHLIEHELAS